MSNNPEIKNFLKKLTLVIVIFSIAIHFSWNYIESSLWMSANANNANFENANITYLGNTAAALSIRLGGFKPNLTNNNTFNGQSISINEVINNPTFGQEKLIATNMINITTYANIIQIDIAKLLDNSANRQTALENHISLLDSYYIKTNDQLNIIAEQKKELTEILNNSTNNEKNAKNILQESYTKLEYNWVDNAIDNFLIAKNLTTRAKIYMIYLERFEKSYKTLQEKNKNISEVLKSNKKAIINKTTVTLPNSGNSLIKELWIIQSEAEYKTKQALE